MTNKPENPSAFPLSASDGDAVHSWQGGMTLRDYFAATVIQGLMMAESKKKIKSKDEYLLRQQAVAEVAYDQADAMLKARR